MIYLDIETTSLDADTGMVVTIGLILPNGKTELFFADKPEKEKEIITEAMDVLRNYQEEPIVIWFSGFDIPFLVTRAVKLGINISDIYSFRIVDLCRLVQDNLKLSSNRLDDVAKFFKVEKNLSIIGKDIQMLYLQAVKGDEKARKEIIDHCRDDLYSMKKIFEKLEDYIKEWLKFK